MLGREGEVGVPEPGEQRESVQPGTLAMPGGSFGYYNSDTDLNCFWLLVVGAA